VVSCIETVNSSNAERLVTVVTGGPLLQSVRLAPRRPSPFQDWTRNAPAPNTWSRAGSAGAFRLWDTQTFGRGRSKIELKERLNQEWRDLFEVERGKALLKPPAVAVTKIVNGLGSFNWSEDRAPSRFQFTRSIEASIG